MLLRTRAWIEVDGEAAFDEPRHPAIDMADTHPDADQRRRALALYGDAGEREVDNLSLVDLTGLELEADGLGAFADLAGRLGDAEITVNRERQLFGHLLALVRAEIKNDGDFAFAAGARDLARHAAEAIKVNDNALTDPRQRRGGYADVAGRNIGGAAVVLAARIVEQAPGHRDGHAPEAAAFANADLGGGEPACGGGEVDLLGGGHAIINARSL